MKKMTKEKLLPLFIICLLGLQLTIWSQGTNDISLLNRSIQFQAYIYNQWINDGFYSHRPMNQEVPVRFTGNVLNAGSNLQTLVTFHTMVRVSNGDTVYSMSDSIPTLSPGTTTSFILPEFLPLPADSIFTASMECSQNETDQVPGNNFAEDVSFSITTKRFISRHIKYTGNFAAQQYTSGNTASAGIYFTVNSIDHIGAMGIFIDTLTEPGVVIIPNLFTVDSGVYTLKAIGMEYQIDSSDIGKWTHIPFININPNDNQLIRGEHYLLQAECYLNGNKLYIGTDNSGPHDFQLESVFIADSMINLPEIPLIQVELSGYLGVQTINNPFANFKIYPNPVQTTLNFSPINFTYEPLRFCILSLNGKEIKKGVLNNKYRVDVSNLAPGAYLIILRDSNQKTSRLFEKL